MVNNYRFYFIYYEYFAILRPLSLQFTKWKLHSNMGCEFWLSFSVKQPEPEADHSPQSNAEVKKAWSLPPLPNTPSWHGAYFSTRTALLYLPCLHEAELHWFSSVFSNFTGILHYINADHQAQMQLGWQWRRPFHFHDLQTARRHMTHKVRNGRIILKDKFRMIRKEVKIVSYIIVISIQAPRSTMQKLFQNRWSENLYLNLQPPENESQVLITTPWCEIRLF